MQSIHSERGNRSGEKKRSGDRNDSFNDFFSLDPLDPIAPTGPIGPLNTVPQRKDTSQRRDMSQRREESSKRQYNQEPARPTSISRTSSQNVKYCSKHAPNHSTNGDNNRNDISQDFRRGYPKDRFENSPGDSSGELSGDSSGGFSEGERYSRNRKDPRDLRYSSQNKKYSYHSRESPRPVSRTGQGPGAPRSHATKPYQKYKETSSKGTNYPKENDDLIFQDSERSERRNFSPPEKELEKQLNNTKKESEESSDSEDILVPIPIPVSVPVSVPVPIPAVPIPAPGESLKQNESDIQILSEGYNIISQFLSKTRSKSDAGTGRTFRQEINLQRGIYYEDYDIVLRENFIFRGLYEGAKIVLRNSARMILGLDGIHSIKKINGSISIDHNSNKLILKPSKKSEKKSEQKEEKEEEEKEKDIPLLFETKDSPKKEKKEKNHFPENSEGGKFPLQKNGKNTNGRNDFTLLSPGEVIFLHGKPYIISSIVSNNILLLSETYNGTHLEIEDELLVYYFNKMNNSKIQNIQIVSEDFLESPGGGNPPPLQSVERTRKSGTVGLQIHNINRLTLKNVSIEGFNVGLELNLSTKIRGKNISIRHNRTGIQINKSLDVRLKNFEIENCSYVGLLLDGIDLTNLVLKGGHIINNEVGLHLIGSGEFLMRECHLEGNAQGTVYARGEKMNLQIEKSKMHDNGNWGIDIKTAGRAIIERCALTDNNSGISLAAEMGGNIIACRLVGNSGIAIEQFSENSKILNSTIQENRRGILVHRSGQIIGNQIHHNDEYGLSIKCSDLTLTNNDITHNEQGLILEGNACHLSNNHFVDNVENLIINGSHNFLQNLIIREGQDGLIIKKDNNIVSDCLIIGQSGRWLDYPKETTRMKNVLRSA